jgi:hypothetical protein
MACHREMELPRRLAARVSFHPGGRQVKSRNGGSPLTAVVSWGTCIEHQAGSLLLCDCLWSCCPCRRGSWGFKRDCLLAQGLYRWCVAVPCSNPALTSKSKLILCCRLWCSQGDDSFLRYYRDLSDFLCTIPCLSKSLWMPSQNPGVEEDPLHGSVWPAISQEYSWQLIPG